ncbi:COP9 signalosome complex subunit 3-like protein [Drosera capensis]
METLETTTAQIQALSRTKSDATHLNNLLKKSEDSIRLRSASLKPYMDQLDPAIHSLGYLYYLEAFTSTPIPKEQADGIVGLIIRFINSCKAEHIRLVPEKFISVCKRLKEQVLQLETPVQGVAAMLTAVKKLQTNAERLTPLHPEFVLLCVLSKFYKYGLNLLEDDIFEIDQPKDLFLYYYYGHVPFYVVAFGKKIIRSLELQLLIECMFSSIRSMVYIGVKRFEKALELLHNVFTAPMQNLNAIAVEAYKKYILVSLIQHGQLPAALPKYTSSVAQRNLKSYAQIYLDLATTYSNGKKSELETYVESNKESFEHDNNLGLVKQVVSLMPKRNIQRLTQTYLTLSLQDIAKTVQLNSPKEAEMHVLQMIQDGEIYATINQKDGMVRFLEDHEQYKTCEMIEHIDSSIQRVMALSRKLASMDESMSCDPLFLGKVGRERTRFDFDDFDTPKFSI